MATLTVVLTVIAFAQFALPNGPFGGDGMFGGEATPAAVLEPETTIDSGPSGLISSSDVGFTFSSNDGTASFECQLDGNGFTSCNSPKSYNGLPDGFHTFEVRAVDLLGIQDSTPDSRSFTIDTTAPTTTITSGPSGSTNSTSASFGFNSDDVDANFECELDGGGWASCNSPKSYGGLSDGSHTFRVRATDLAGNTDSSVATRTWTVDIGPPETTIGSGPSGITSSTSASFQFSSSESGSTFECELDGGGYASCSSPESYSGLAEGSHTFRVRATDSAGNTDSTEAIRSWTIDTTPPDTSITSGPTGMTNSRSATFNFSSTESGSSFECKLDGGSWASCNTPKTYTSLSDASHTFSVRATDGAGNTDTSEAIRTWAVDAGPPVTAIDQGPSGTTNSSTATFDFSSNEAGSTFECQLDGGGFSACSSPKTYSGLSDGSHSFQVKATDPAGNTDQSPVTRIWTVDTTPPDTSISSGPSGTSTSTSATFAFASTESGSSFECQLDGGSWTGCTSPKTYSGLSDASHTFSVRATDAAGNTDASEASQTWTVDSAAPETTIQSHPGSLTNSQSASFGFTSSESGSSFECKLDSGAWQSCSSPHGYSGLGGGSHTFQVRATDALGNTDATPDSHSWTVDLTPPNTTIGSGPGMLSGSSSATFTFTSSEGGSSFECKLDGNAWEACSSPKSYSGLADGSHLFSVKGADAAGNVDPSEDTYNWTVLTTEPDTTIDSGPGGPTSDNTPTFAFSSTEAGSTFQCRLDGPGGAVGSYSVCTNPKTYSTLADGTYTFYVRAVNAVGNVDQSAATRSFSVDSIVPNTSIVSGPSGLTNSTSATFDFSSSELGSTFECKLEPDQADYEPCSPPKTYTGLPDGLHTFRVRAMDQVGQTDASPASRSFTIDTTPPDTTITVGPSGTISDETPTFEFTASAGGTSFECRFDSDPFAPCSSPHTPAGGLTNATHTFEVQAKDAAGNVDPSPASRQFTVNTAAPDTLITSGPSGATSSTAASFSFSADETGATFECQLDGGAWQAACASPKPYSGLSQGSHTFQVRATDPQGNTDQTPAVQTWIVDTIAPNTTINTGPSGTVTTSAASFTFSSNEPGSTFECKLEPDQASFSSCSSPASYSSLGDGPHTFRVRAIDPAGNRDLTEATRTWTVDTTVPDTVIDSGPSGATGDNTPTFTFSSEAGASFQCKLDGPGTATGSYSACSSPKNYTSALADGSYTFSVVATDSGGTPDPTAATRAFTVDTVKPQTTITAGPSGTVSSNTATFTFSSEPGSTFECKLDTQPFGPCSSGITYGPLADGSSHTFRVKATDAAGNLEAQEEIRSWSVDATVPDTVISAAPPAFIAVGNASFTFTSESGATFQCKLDRAGAPPPAAALAPCTSPKSYTALIDGSYTFTVVATDPGGNVDPTPATASFTVDTIKPTTSILTRPVNPTNETTANFTFSSNEQGATFECRLTGDADYTPCTSPKAYSGLNDGVTYTFRVRAVDQAGNKDASTTACQSGPPPTPAPACTRYDWIVNTSLPDTNITSGPSDPTNSTSATFRFTSNETGSTFECKLDAEAEFTPCTSPHAVANLSEGRHTFAVRAVDTAGNRDPVEDTKSWTVDLTSPETRISSGPSGNTTSTSATLGFSSSEGGSSFQCRIDGGAWGACSSPKVYADLSTAHHTFDARAIDPAGNVDPSPARQGWTVVPPPTFTSAGPAGPQLLSPFPVVRISGKFTRRGVLLKVFQVSVRDGMKVTIRCDGKRCPFARQSRTASRRASGTKRQAHASKLIRIRRLEGRLLLAGTKVEVFVTKPGMIGKYTRFKIRKSKPPRRTDRCLLPGSTKPSACPA